MLSSLVFILLSFSEWQRDRTHWEEHMTDRLFNVFHCPQLKFESVYGNVLSIQSLSLLGDTTKTKEQPNLTTTVLTHKHWASLVAQLVKNPSAMRKTWVRSLGWEDSLEEGMTVFLPTSVFLPGKSHEQRNLAACGPWRHRESRHDRAIFTLFDTLHYLSLNHHICYSLRLTHYNSLRSLKFSGFAKNLVEPS